MDRILATHTGSLIRPPDVLEFLGTRATVARGTTTAMPSR